MVPEAIQDANLPEGFESRAVQVKGENDQGRPALRAEGWSKPVHLYL